MKSNRRLALNILIIALILVLAFALLIGTTFIQKKGKAARITVDQKVVKTLPLDRNTCYTITTPDGGENTVVIEDNSVRMETANCPDGLCIHMGTIRMTKQSIVCLPHKVVVEIVGESVEDEDTLDGITG